MPAFKKWNLKYMKEVFGNTPVEADVFESLEDMQITHSNGVSRAFQGEFLELSRKLFNKEPPFYYPSNWYLSQKSEPHNKLIQDCVHPSDDYRNVKHDFKSAISFFMETILILVLIFIYLVIF